jgi:hypothetical protein
MAVAWPLVRAALAANLPGVVGSSVTVQDGPVVSGNYPSVYLSIADQPSTDVIDSGSFRQSLGPDGWSAMEDGVILGELAGITGDPTVPDVFATFALIAAYVQADPTLGGVLEPAAVLTVAADNVLQGQTQAGAVQRLLLSFNYSTRI